MNKKNHKKPISKNCDCFEQLQKDLNEKGLEFHRDMYIDFGAGKARMSRPLIRVNKTVSRSRVRVPSIECEHCPFCGEKYE